MLPDRGIGRNGTISWPSISKDYQHYMQLTSRTEYPKKKCVNIKGRVTWEETGEPEKCRPNIINIVISKKLRERPEHVHYLVKSFEDALKLVSTPPLSEEIERVWVMGGQSVYTQALKSPYCRRIYMTKIFAHHPSDSFFPEMSGADFQLIKDPTVEDGMQEENGTSFKYEVYENIKH